MTARMRLAGPLLTWACLLLVAPPAAPAAAQDARVTNDVDTTLVTVGDRIQMTVTVEHGVGARVVWPDSLDLSPFEVLGAQASPPATAGGRVRSSAVLTLTAFELGPLEIPSFDLRVVGPGEAVETLSTDRFGVEVVSVGLDEAGDIRDIRGPLGIPVGVITVSLWLLLLLLALGAVYGLYRRSRRGLGDTVEEAGPPVRPAHEVALEALQRIEGSPLLERGQVKEYHIEVSETLRRYVEARFRVHALEMTTREVVDGLRRVRADGDLIDELRRFLDQCDMVKFAKLRPTSEASQSTLDLGRHLVMSSVPVPADELAEAAEEASGDVLEELVS